METKKPKILYLDLDGVMCDFDKQVHKLFGNNPDDLQSIKSTETTKEYIHRIGSNQFWKKIRTSPEFWSSMDPIEGSIEAFKRLYPLFDSVCIISNPDKKDLTNCINQKNKWVDTYLSGYNLKRIYLENKYIYANPNCLLIDDLEKNIKLWKQYGGKTIHFTKYDDNFWNQVNEFLIKSVL